MKTMKIELKNKTVANNELLKMAKAFDSKKRKQRNLAKSTFFESLVAVRGVLTDKRLEVWRTIRDYEPKSITELAKKLKREFRAVHRDVMLLAEIGLIQLTESEGSRGKAQNLKSNYDELSLSVA